jgi:Tfp pilus assembly protein PilO
MKEKYKITLIITIFLLLDSLLVYFLVVPAVSKIKKSSLEYLRYKERIATIKAELSNFKDFEKNHRLYLKGLEEMEELVSGQLFVDREVPTELVNFCQTEAQKNNLALAITPLSLKEKKEPFDFVALQMRLEGQFPDFLRFLKRLENSQWLINTEKVFLSREKGKIEASLIIKAYAKAKD